MVCQCLLVSSWPISENLLRTFRSQIVLVLCWSLSGLWCMGAWPTVLRCTSIWTRFVTRVLLYTSSHIAPFALVGLKEYGKFCLACVLRQTDSTLYDVFHLNPLLAHRFIFLSTPTIIISCPIVFGASQTKSTHFHISPKLNIEVRALLQSRLLLNDIAELASPKISPVFLR